jgi:type II secretory pathway component PulF
MALGHGGRFFSQLAFFLRRQITIREALDLLAGELPAPGWAEAVRRIGGRINRGESLGKALAEFPPPFPREVLPFVEEMESEGLLVDELEVLAAWPDEGTTDPSALLARVFAHTSILLRRRQTISEALRRAVSPADPESLRTALRAVSKASILDQSLSEVMGESPGVFSPAVRRMVLQMERNGDAATTFRDLSLALARGWFPTDPHGTRVL